MAPGQLPDYTILGLAVIFLIAWFFLWFIHLAAIIHASRRLYRSRKLRKDNAETPLPGVSILKPITGADPHLAHNLETFFQLNYPFDKYELLFCLQDKNDPAIPLIENLRMKYPHVSSNIFIGGEMVGINPKINNMMPGYKIFSLRNGYDK
jgi:ceramide glucosyltransferase